MQYILEDLKRLVKVLEDEGKLWRYLDFESIKLSPLDRKQDCKFFLNGVRNAFTTGWGLWGP